MRYVKIYSEKFCKNCSERKLTAPGSQYMPESQPETVFKKFADELFECVKW